jgi:hypothetical protein
MVSSDYEETFMIRRADDVLFFLLTCPEDFLILTPGNAGSYSFHHFAAPNFYLFQHSAGGIP